MSDVVDKNTRSKMMSGIRGKDTSPELLIRVGLHTLGFRYRLHNAALPGKPDMVFPKYSAVIQVNGCFWHRHNCHLFKLPKTRQQFWQQKLEGNAARDGRNIAELESMGWKVLTVWECALKGRDKRKLPEVIHTAAHWIQFGEESAAIEGHVKI
jgi:DNA mismatch endonuclease (patch repair protein)